MRLLLLVFIFSFANVVLGEKINYTGYKLVRLFPKNQNEWEEVGSLRALGIDSLSKRRDHVDLLFPPHSTELLTGMKENGITFNTVFEDVQKAIDSQKVNKEKVVNGELEWDRYYELSDIHQFLEDQAAKHAGIALIESLGKSYEGRDMKAIKISKSGETKPAIWVDANIHAREWITGAVCTFLIDQLLNSNDTEIQSWLDDFDFYILPVLNVDGYEFTHTTDRFWRKSRNPNDSPVGCIGTDLNRNFDYYWNTEGGASDDPCDNGYRGSAAWSNNETRNIRDYLTPLAPRLVFYLSMHSHGQFILFPTGLNADRIPQYNTYMRIANRTAEAHRQRFGTEFKPGSIFDEMYIATGSSMDWVKETLKTNLTFAYELRDQGRYGQLLPPEQIYDSALEFMDGFKVIIEELRNGIPEVDP